MASAVRFETQTDPNVHDELCARIAQLNRDFRLLSVGELCRRAEAIRVIAQAHGLNPAERVAADLRLTLENQGRDLAIAPYLDRMCEAVGCQRPDPVATQAFLSNTVAPLRTVR